MSKLNVLVACGAGMGSSQMLKMTAEKVFKELGIEVTISHCAIDEARSSAKNYDLLLVNERFVDTIKPNDHIIGLKNILDKKEIKSKLQDKGYGKK